MKKVINKKVYDTEKAELLHSWSNGEKEGDWLYKNEILFISKNGQYFVIGSGGEITSYALRYAQKGKTGDYLLWLIDKEETINWLENHEGDEVLLKHKLFKGVVKEG